MRRDGSYARGPDVVTRLDPSKLMELLFSLLETRLCGIVNADFAELAFYEVG
jgi:hypothetical protein